MDEAVASTDMRESGDDRADGLPHALFADEDAFRAWYDAALPRVYGYLFNRCGRNHDLAEELTQQAFVEAIRSRHRWDGRDPIRWLIGIARHRLIDHLRWVEVRERGLRRLLTLQPTVTWAGSDVETGDAWDAAAQLPAAQRAAVILRYVDDLPVREVAKLMRRSESAVESLLSRGRDAMRRQLSETT